MSYVFVVYVSDISQSSKQQKGQRLKAKPKPAPAKVSKIPKFTANPLKTKKKKRGAGMSDVDSVRTEDYENSFHKMMVKQVGYGGPMVTIRLPSGYIVIFKISYIVYSNHTVLRLNSCLIP